MHFLQAYVIVHDFCGAFAKERKTMLIPYSSVRHSTQELMDAFVIFFGHMVMFNTRTKEEYEQYKIMVKFLYFVVPDDTYNLISANAEILEKAEKSSVFRMMNKNAIKTAEASRRMEMQLCADASQKNFDRINILDYGAAIMDFQDLKQKYFQIPKEKREDYGIFMDEYIQKVYSYTSYKTPSNEDYSCFWSFDSMRDFLKDFDSLAPVAQKVYSEYRGLILNSR